MSNFGSAPLIFSTMFHSFLLFSLSHEYSRSISDLKVNVQCLRRFDTLEHMVGETLVIFYVHPFIFLRFFSRISKVFINIHEYTS